MWKPCAFYTHSSLICTMIHKDRQTFLKCNVARGVWGVGGRLVLMNVEFEFVVLLKVQWEELKRQHSSKDCFRMHMKCSGWRRIRSEHVDPSLFSFTGEWAECLCRGGVTPEDALKMLQIIASSLGFRLRWMFWQTYATYWHSQHPANFCTDGALALDETAS